MADEGDKVSPTYRPLLPPRNVHDVRTSHFFFGSPKPKWVLAIYNSKI